MKRILFTAAAAAAALTGALALAAPAMAGNGPTAVTHLNNHPDTTNIPEPLGPGQYLPGATVSSPGGPVWAYDNITEKFTITPERTPDTYLVSIDIVGSFHGFANPRTADEMTAAGLSGPAPAAALDSTGSVKGTIAYDVVVQPGQSPDPANLPGQSASNAHLGDNISLLFDGHTVSISQAATGYTFTYHKVAGADYTQVG
jgi:hypothetical protein